MKRKVNVENRPGHERRSAVTWTIGNNSNVFFFTFSHRLMSSVIMCVDSSLCCEYVVWCVSPDFTEAILCCVAHSVCYGIVDVAHTHTHAHKYFGEFSLFLRLIISNVSYKKAIQSVEPLWSRQNTIVEYFIPSFLHPFVFNFTNLLK